MWDFFFLHLNARSNSPPDLPREGTEKSEEWNPRSNAKNMEGSQAVGQERQGVPETVRIKKDKWPSLKKEGGLLPLRCQNKARGKEAIKGEGCPGGSWGIP